MNEQEAIMCLRRNGFTVEVTSETVERPKDELEQVKPFGLKCWTALDCLKNYYGYRIN